MNNVYLPTLKKIHIKNFSLYPNGLNLEYDFIDGVNLIIGGNGTGKTTFINLIKYALLGLYKKELDVRIYKGEKREIRSQYSDSYFRNRMDNAYQYNEDAKVIIDFVINGTFFQVTRGIYEIELEKVKIKEQQKEYFLDGEIIKQHKYERLEENEKVKYLQYEYEKKICEKTNLATFDDFILFVNDILLFDERRRTILWDFNFQSRIMHKYFSNPSLNKEYEDLLREVKYYDSLARHKSEDARAIRSIIDEIDKKIYKKTDKEKLTKKIVELKAYIDRLNSKIDNLLKNRQNTEYRLKIAFSELNEVGKKIKDLEQMYLKQENLLYSALWENLNPQYDTFLSNIIHNNTCPLCNKVLEKHLLDKITQSSNQCMLCNEPIKQGNKKTPELEQLQTEIEKLLAKKQSIEKSIFSYEKELEQYDSEYTKYTIERNEKQIEMRELQNIVLSKEEAPSEYIIMQNQIEKLLYERDEFRRKSFELNEKVKKIELDIDYLRTNITKDLSNIFSEYGGKFLGMPCYLSYTNADSKNEEYKYIPYIAEKPRIDPEELSESQRFFIDHSFRMSLLDYFYTNSTFFVCETPDSSLDISYERNAADIFLNFLKKPNTLIITSNLNNSEFLYYLIENTKKINCINLLKLGKQTEIQSTSESLINISNRIEEKINGKRKND